MTDLSSQGSAYFHRVVLHAIIVLSIGLIAGLMLTFSLLDAVNLWPLPVWECPYRVQIGAGLPPMLAGF